MPYDGIFFSACLASYVVLMNDEGKVCLMRRTNTGWRDGYYGVPAGKVERHETFLETAVRETEEETGVKINPEDMKLFLIQNRFDDTQEKTKDWVDLFFFAQKWSGTPRIMEADKSDSLEWFSLDALPGKIVPNVADALTQLQSKNLNFSLFSTESTNQKVA